MTLPKGYARLSIKKSVQGRMDGIKRLMAHLEPDKYDENTSYSAVVSWLIDDSRKHHSKEMEKL